MTTSWNETRQIEQHLSGTAAPGDALLFEAKLMLDPTLADKVQWQQKTYDVVRRYGRARLKKEIEAVHHQLFTAPEHQGFRQRIRRLFTKS